MKMKRTLFGCFLPPERPRSHKENAVFFNSIILNSDVVFAKVAHDQEHFRGKMRKLFTNVKGEQIHVAIQELYETLLGYPELASMAQAIMAAAQNAVSLDGVADEEEVLLLRDRWLRRINNAPSDSETGENDSVRGNVGRGFITLPIFIATNRNKVGGHVKRFFGTGRAAEVSWAVMWLSLPDTHGYGETDSPTWRYSPKRSGAPGNKIVHLTTVPVEEQCVHKLSETMKDLGEKECIVFTHGYNTTLANACKRMAQIAYAGNFRGPSFVFSWPSNQSMASYSADEANVMWAVPDFLKTLQMLRNKLGMEKVHLLAHSMGSRLALYSLLRLPPAESDSGAAKIGRVVLAAPDFDMGEFMYLSEEITQRCERLTLYCSAEDQALHLSRSIHGGYPRLGDFRGFVEMATNPKMRALENLDAIDTTGTDNSWMRHAYVFDACGIIMDCCVVLRVGLPPQERSSLILAKLPSGLVYWTFETTSTGLLTASSLKKSTDVLCKLGFKLPSINFKATVSGKQHKSKVAIDDDPSGQPLAEAQFEENQAAIALLKTDGSDVEHDVVEEDGRYREEFPDKTGDHGAPISRPKNAVLASKRFMDEFGFHLVSPSVGGTLHVDNEGAEEVGGSDVVLPSDAEIALDFNATMFKRTFSRSKSMDVGSFQRKVSRSLTMGNGHLRR